MSVTAKVMPIFIQTQYSLF